MRKDESTLPPSALTGEIRAEDAASVLALVVLWSRHEPARLGEVLLLDLLGVAPGEPWIFGRGEAEPGERRLALVRQRPGSNEAAGPLSSPRISRTQLLLHRDEHGAIEVESAGRCPLEIDGRACDRATLARGALVELKNELLLLCVERPPRLPALLAPRAFPFGEADAHGMIGESPALWQLRASIAAAARRSAHVLVQGPSGAGKELVARALHAESARAGKPLCARNAATIPEGLVDAELFGNARNYPNPGTPERPGLIGEADGGVLFLDEIAELPARLQAHLLRVLDDGEYHRLGEASARRSDFRLIGATNRPESALKHDVLARLKIRLCAPGLDERPEDIPLLAAALLRRHARADPAIAERFFPDASPDACPRFAPALVSALVKHAYTTHLRELEALLIAATTESRGRYLELGEGVRARLAASAPAAAPLLVFSDEERARLDLQRRHGFRATDCGRDPAYPGNRQTADLHLRQLACKALAAAGWELGAAAQLLAGEADDDLRARARARLDTFLDNLERRLAELEGDAGARRRALAGEWRGDGALLLGVLEALEQGVIQGRAAPRRPEMEI
jgi:two-component system nitrogen regulation response regulator GlnG/two-component system response regulator HydG